MGRSVTLLFGLLALNLGTGCGRNFEAPAPEPDVIRIDGFEPKRAFFDRPITLHGANFETPADQNLVFFGGISAQVETDPPPPEGQLVVRVPELIPGQQVTVTVSNASGQASAPDLFTYKGPGHPLSEQVHHALPLESAPNTVSVVLPDEALTNFKPVLVTNTSSRTVSLLDMDTGWHMDLGFPGRPLSAVLLPWVDRPADIAADPALANWPDEWSANCFSLVQYAMYASALVIQADQEDSPSAVVTQARSLKLSFVVQRTDRDETTCGDAWQGVETGLGWVQVVLSELPATHHLLPSTWLAETPVFMPDQILPLCIELASDGTCNVNMLVITDLFRPLMALMVYRLNGSLSGGRELDLLRAEPLTTEGSACATQVSDPPGPILDVAHTPGSHNFLAVVADRPEIWEIRFEKPDEFFQYEEGAVRWPRQELAPLSGNDLAALGWETEVFDPASVCQPRFTAMTVSEEESRPLIYAADQVSLTVFEAELREMNLPVVGLVSGFVPRRGLYVGSPVFAMATGQRQSELDENLADRELLYVASEQGLFLAEVWQQGQDGQNPPPLQVADFLSLPGSRGAPGSLVRYGHALDTADDRILLADTVRNRIFALPVGDLTTDPLPILVGSTSPRVAASQFADSLYLTDPLSNTIRLIDQQTGLQDGEFSVHNQSAFGAMGIACLHENGSDLVLVPLAEDAFDAVSGRHKIEKIVVRQAQDWGQVLGYGESLVLPDQQDTQSRDDLMAHPFHEILVAAGRGVVFLVRYSVVPNSPFEDERGLVWPAVINPTAGLDRLLLDGEELANTPRDPDGELDPIDPNGRPLPDHVQMVRLSADEQWLLAYGIAGSSQGQPVGRLHVYPTGDPLAEATFSVDIAPPTSLLVSDVALWSRGNLQTIFLTLPFAGQVLALRPLSAGSYSQSLIETTGEPSRMFFSPDGRRLYVTHHSQGRVSIIETECREANECDSDAMCGSNSTCALGLCQPSGGCVPVVPCADGQACPEGSECIDGQCSWGHSEEFCAPSSSCSGPGGTCVPDSCAQLHATLPVNADPDQVAFHPSGKRAYLTHSGSNIITVIE